MADYWREFQNDAFNVLTQGSRMSNSERPTFVTPPGYRPIEWCESDRQFWKKKSLCWAN